MSGPCSSAVALSKRVQTAVSHDEAKSRDLMPAGSVPRLSRARVLVVEELAQRGRLGGEPGHDVERDGPVDLRRGVGPEYLHGDELVRGYGARRAPFGHPGGPVRRGIEARCRVGGGHLASRAVGSDPRLHCPGEVLGDRRSPRLRRSDARHDRTLDLRVGVLTRTKLCRRRRRCLCGESGESGGCLRTERDHPRARGSTTNRNTAAATASTAPSAMPTDLRTVGSWSRSSAAGRAMASSRIRRPSADKGPGISAPRAGSTWRSSVSVSITSPRLRDVPVRSCVARSGVRRFRRCGGGGARGPGATGCRRRWRSTRGSPPPRHGSSRPRQ